MKKNLYFLLIFLYGANCYSQIIFEKGYFINNANQTVQCEIKNIGWRTTPTEFEYRLSENGKTQKVFLTDIKEFGIDGVSKYIRENVNIDVSVNNVNSLVNNKKPVFEAKTLFLEVLLEGKANLYQYSSSSNTTKYFYNKDNTGIKQLVFKFYKSSYNTIGTNNHFRQQLWKDLKCNTIEINDIENLQYRKKSLINFFVDYNKCNNSKLTTYESKNKKNTFNLSIKPRINNSSLKVADENSSIRSINFSNQVNFGIGIEAEIILPFRKNKWSVFIEPSYQYYNDQATRLSSGVVGGEINSTIEYSSIEIPIGIRHYMFINSDSKIFINAAFVYDIASGTQRYTRSDGSEITPANVSSNSNLGLGIGYKFKNKFSLEYRLQTSRDILNNGDGSDYKTTSVIFGYTFF